MKGFIKQSSIKKIINQKNKQINDKQKKISIYLFIQKYKNKQKN